MPSSAGLMMEALWRKNPLKTQIGQQLCGSSKEKNACCSSTYHDVAIIQRALDLHQQGRGPHLLGNFMEKGFAELLTIRQGSDMYLEGQCALDPENNGMR